LFPLSRKRNLEGNKELVALMKLGIRTFRRSRKEKGHSAMPKKEEKSFYYLEEVNDSEEGDAHVNVNGGVQVA